MIDSSDALLLRPARPDCGFSLEPPDRRPALDSAIPQGIIVATIYSLPAPVDADFLAFFEGTVGPLLRGAGAIILAAFVSEHSRNNFPRLELREGENVFILFAGFKDLAAYHAHMTTLGRNPHWRGEVAPALMRRTCGRPHVLRLAPTSRSHRE